MATKSPAALASTAAEAIRSLNYATLNSGRASWRHPDDAYSVIGGLDHAASMMPQAIDQIGALLSKLADDGSMRSDRGTLDRDVVEALAALADARVAAQKLNAALSRAHTATSHLAWED